MAFSREREKTRMAMGTDKVKEKAKDMVKEKAMDMVKEKATDMAKSEKNSSM